LPRHQAIIYPGFPANTSAADVAVLIMERPLPFSANIRPICLPVKGETFRGLAATTLGWGQYLSFIEAWRRFADPGLVSRTANLTSQQMMAAVKVGNQAEKDFYDTFRQTVNHLFPGMVARCTALVFVKPIGFRRIFTFEVSS
jgi:hypothetical protein